MEALAFANLMSKREKLAACYELTNCTGDPLSPIDPRHRLLRTPGFRALILTSAASAALAVNCGGTVEGQMTGAGGTMASDGAAGAHDAGLADVLLDSTVADGPCVPRARGLECTSPLTGCPSNEECKADGTSYDCLCDHCRLELEPGECSWTLHGRDLLPTAATTSVLVPPPGGGIETVVPERPGQSACGASPGWYAEQTADTLTVQLCPVSCSEHQADPRKVFLLSRQGCPVEG